MELRLDGIADTAREAVQAWFDDLGGKLETRLEAGVVSGEAVLPGFVSGRSSISVMLLVDEVDPALLHLVGTAWKRHARKGIKVPLVLASSELARSLDAFPVEFLDLKATGRTVWGDFDLESIDIELPDLRLQAERELRGLLLHTRLAHVQFGTNERGLGELVAAGIGKLSAIERAVALLLCYDADGSRTEISDRLADILETDAQILEELSVGHRT